MLVMGEQHGFRGSTPFLVYRPPSYARTQHNRLNKCTTLRDCL